LIVHENEVGTDPSQGNVQIEKFDCEVQWEKKLSMIVDESTTTTEKSLSTSLLNVSIYPA
jgi:hypothetical protein